VDIRRDLAGLVTEAGFDDGTQLTTGRNAMGLAVSNAWAHGASPIISETRAYDGRSRIDAVTWSDGAAYAFGYDAIGQLASSRIETAGGLWDSTYDYDGDYNLSRLTRNGTVLEFSYDANDRLIQAGSERFGWDPNGNLARVSSGALVETLTYDVYDRLIRFVRTGVDPVDIRYEYDYDGLLRSRCDDDRCSRFLWDRSAEPYPMLREEVDESGSLVARYYHDGRYVTHSVAADGTVRKYALDHVGSPVRTIAGGAVVSSVTYDAFGVVLEGTPGRIGWGNALLDEDTGLLFMRSRWYSPAMRRFVHADSAIPNPTRPASVNRYIFAANDPVNRTDPSGQSTFTQIEVMSVIKSIATVTAKYATPVIGGTTTLLVGAAAANALRPGGAFNGENEATARFYNPDGLGGVTAFSVGFPGRGVGPLTASAGLSLGWEFIDVYARSFLASYRFFGPSIGIGKSSSIFKKLGTVSYGASLVGKSEIYNVYRWGDYEGPFAAVSGAISVPPNIKAAIGSIAFLKLLPLNGGGGSLFWSPFRETVDETTGAVTRPSWGWRLGLGHTTKKGVSISLSFTYYLWTGMMHPYLP
ncbi:MAG: RHS repeat-associated core domain-containing protein, partial [Halieaceae bacterium]|nr:RHS repeat-associated core domain-containing protein [Halieaceae bacterium]